MKACHLILFTCLLCSVMVNAQVKGDLYTPSLDFEFPFTITQYSTRHGLPQNQVVDIISKKNGNLVLSTANGIVEYSSTEFRPIESSGPYKYAITSRLLWHDGTRQLFGQQTNGLLRLISPHEKILGRFTACIDGYTLTCIDTGGRIFRAHVSDLQLKEIHHTSIDSAICIFYQDHRYYIGTRKGLYCYDEQQKKTLFLIDGTFLNIVRNPYDKKLYALGSSGTWILGPDPVKFFDPGKNKTYCQDIAFTETGECYVSTNHGLYRLTNGHTERYDKSNGLPSEYMQSLYYNQNDRCLYAGTIEKGLLRLQLKTCSTYSSKQGFSEGCFLTSVLETGAGEILVASACNYIYKINPKSVEPYIGPAPLFSSLSEIDGRLYAGTWGQGLRIFEQKKNVGSTNVSSGFQPFHYVHSTFKDRTGYLWIGTGRGIAKGKTFETLQPYYKDSITGSIICFYQRRNGDLCIGGNTGVYILNEQHRLIRHLGQPQGLTGKEVRSFYEDENGKLWIGTYDGGLYCYDSNRLVSVKRLKNAMLPPDAFCLAPDGQGYLYMTSNQGLWRISAKDLEDFYQGKISYLVPFYYSEADGILNTEFNGGFQNNFLKASNGRLYFPNMQGVVAVTPEKPVFRKLSPVIDRIYVNDTLVSSLEEPLERTTHSIRFDFSCNSYLDRYNVYYQYKIERNGTAAEWSALQKNNFISFYALRPGEYTFTLRAIDAFNDRQPIEVHRRFEIHPYFYETTWFIIAMGIGFLVLTIVTGRQRMQVYRRKAEKRESRKRRLAELELKALHERMNPHFVFNSLNSIKYYLSVNDKDNADKYLDGFSVLLRKFTEYSSQNFITVREEMEIISTYVQLEKMRMNNTFETHIEVDPAVLDKLIPTINIQPFVENAIKHGIAHAVKPCYLRISVTAVGEYMIRCVIEDNGIGRKRSREINAGRQGHISSGIKIVEEKKQIMQALYNIGITLVIEDRTDANGEPAGTTVILEIPIKK